MKQSRIHPYYMSLIRDAAWCELEKTKQVWVQVAWCILQALADPTWILILMCG